MCLLKIFYWFFLHPSLIFPCILFVEKTWFGASLVYFYVLYILYRVCNYYPGRGWSDTNYFTISNSRTPLCLLIPPSSGCCPLHATSTALFKVISSLHIDRFNGHFSVLFLLDLCPAFGLAISFLLLDSTCY